MGRSQVISLAAAGGIGGDFAVAGFGRVMVLDLLHVADRVAADHYQVAHVVCFAFAGFGVGGVEPFVGRFGQQLVQGIQFTRFTGKFLPMDFLKAKHIGAQAQQLGAQDGNTFFERRPFARLVIQILQVKRRNS